MNSQKPQRIFQAKAYAGVMQDKDAPRRIYAGSSEPVSPSIPAPISKKPKHHGSNKRQTVEVAGYVKPFIRAELERIAKQQNLSLSKVVATLLERSIQAHIDMQYGAMLRPVIEAAVKKEIHAATDRTTRLALNAFLAAEQSRVLTIHILSLLLGSSTDVLPELVKESQKQAWANLRTLMGEEGGEN
jgi:hypothetical protein